MTAFARPVLRRKRGRGIGSKSVLSPTHNSWSKFKQETGIIKSDWFPEFWFRWSDAIEEAGFIPNVFTKAHSKDFIISRLIDLIIEIKHFPIHAELELKRKKDKSFPNAHSIYKLGNKVDRAQAIIDFINSNFVDNHEKIITICQEIIAASPNKGEIGLELPEKIKPIHYVETDDPSGIEAYWHNRFKSKNINGEWFKLSTEDIKTFKKWKKIF